MEVAALEHSSNTPIVWSLLTRVRLSTLRAAFVFLAMTAAIAGPASAASRNDEARAFFTRFVAAKSAHDLTAVTALLWESPDML
ncbi:hypothetical protein [Labrys sp. ZIDIC5]|uniref:hypothetical protein n=1 Tax=Labrys sedimenti TaxID=3106036 RepID=UPI002ACA8A70|nr:hypothetical protein [Labrys sp. ZIDIC5]MDZ5450510.1 hypothetical protein [Labrys sp. ZIDIC5]